jgi:hypothetical protein
MSKHQIRCITKADRHNPHERILAIGGVNPNGTNWKLTQQAAIDSINSGKYSFYVEINGRKVDVIAAISRYGYWYIKTEADGEEPNNLLSLMECK